MLSMRAIYATSLMLLVVACTKRHQPVPSANAEPTCVQQCRQNEAVCLQGANTGNVNFYGDGRAALIGAFASMLATNSARDRCAEALDVCYSTCSANPDQAQATVATLCAQLRCPNGLPGLYLGEAKAQQGARVGVAAVLCRQGDAPLIQGEWACFPTAGVQCVTQGGKLTGKLKDRQVTMVSDQLPGGLVSTCEFSGLVMSTGDVAGDYSCKGGRGENAGSFVLNFACR